MPTWMMHCGARRKPSCTALLTMRIGHISDDRCGSRTGERNGTACCKEFHDLEMCSKVFAGIPTRRPTSSKATRRGSRLLHSQSQVNDRSRDHVWKCILDLKLLWVIYGGWRQDGISSESNRFWMCRIGHLQRVVRPLECIAVEIPVAARRGGPDHPAGAHHEGLRRASVNGT